MLCVAHVHLDELAAEILPLTARSEQAKAERDRLAIRMRRMEAVAATGNRWLAIVMRDVHSLKRCVAAGEYRAITKDAWACETSDWMSSFEHFSKG